MTRKIALITGGSRGLGRSATAHLAARGVDVLFTYRSRREDAEAVVAAIEEAGVRGAALPLDVGDSTAFPAFARAVCEQLARWDVQRLNFLVNNAGIGIHAPFAQTTESQFDELVRVHLKGPFFLTQTLLPLLADGASIVNVSSGLARFTMPGYAAYAAMKGAVEVLTRYQAKELGVRRIRVNTLAPGAIETDFGGGVVRDNAAMNQQLAAQTALGRVGLPDDIGAAVAALLCADMDWVNGQRVEASGGMFL
jgi:NAD(P)-dependent dehydrogenase (short-subunit alcohol dehydrogenase family)